MARATRSSIQQQSEATSPSTSTPVRGKAAAAASKKRKRNSIADTDEQPASKQLRSADVSIKEETEDSQEPEDSHAESVGDKPPHLKNVGDVPIKSEDAEKILDILEMIDTQGLLDRVFPLPSSTAEPSSSQPASYSFRTLLKESSQHPLCILRSAVQHLFPISSHPRARPSIPAAQQLGFCILAISLLDQASFHSVAIPLDIESIFASTQDALTGDQLAESKANKGTSKSPSSPSVTLEPPPPQKRKYALTQKLAGTEWWTSLNVNVTAESLAMDGKEFKDLPTAHAELVAILSSSSTSEPAAPVSTLGSYSSRKTPWPKVKSLGPRRASCGKFLEYGPYMSFAPTYEGSGVEVGRRMLGETLWRWEQRRSEIAHEKRIAQDLAVSIMAVDDDDVEMDGVKEVTSTNTPSLAQVTNEGLEGLLPPEEIATIKASLGSLELEAAVAELLERNTKALHRLGELQRLRLGTEKGGTSVVEEGSEEWDLAQGILNSLTILTSMRPRSSDNRSGNVTLVPTPSVLHKLHRTLPIAASQGWYGTLPPMKTTALRDDSTIRVKSGTVIPAIETAAPTPVTPAANLTAPFSQFRGTYQQQSHYKPGQTYYPGQYGVPPQTQTQTQNTIATYYPNQQYGQMQYQHPNYYYQGQPTPGTAAATNTANGRGTPQTTPATGPYGGYYNYNNTTQQRAVANTVVAAAKTNGVAPIPAHLRNPAWGGSASQPGTPGVASGGYQFGNTFQATTPAAR